MNYKQTLGQTLRCRIGDASEWNNLRVGITIHSEIASTSESPSHFNSQPLGTVTL